MKPVQIEFLMVEVIGAMTTIVRYIFKSEGVTTTHGRVFAISPPRVGSNSTQYTPYCSTMSNPQTFHPQTHQG